MDRLIRRDGAAAHLDRLGAFARARGELSAATAGRAGIYHSRCADLEFPAPMSDTEGRLAGLRDRGHEDAAALGVPIAGPAAGYAHALIDAVCLYVPGPGWTSIGDPVATGLADQYRRALARGVPAAQDDQRYGFALAAACASWALLRLHRFAVLDTRAPGYHSRLQLVETLESAARTAEAHRPAPSGRMPQPRG